MTIVTTTEHYGVVLDYSRVLVKQWGETERGVFPLSRVLVKSGLVQLKPFLPHPRFKIKKSPVTEWRGILFYFTQSKTGNFADLLGYFPAESGAARKSVVWPSTTLITLTVLPFSKLYRSRSVSQSYNDRESPPSSKKACRSCGHLLKVARGIGASWPFIWPMT